MFLAEKNSKRKFPKSRNTVAVLEELRRDDRPGANARGER